jgi:tetratricopeptide (TPR) repeat protein
MAGVGKTALAVHWARTVMHRFPDGQLHANLRGSDPDAAPSAAEVTGWFLVALGVPAELVPADPDVRAELYRNVLASRRVLIVLDNARDARQVRPLLPGSPGCLVIVTSRSSLAGLIPADGTRQLQLAPLDEGGSARLLATRLGAERVAAEPAAAGQLARLCGGLPLALALLAARAAETDLPLSTLARQLAAAAAGEATTPARPPAPGAERTGGRLDALQTDDLATGVRAIFFWSSRQLTADGARMFRLLSLHPGPDINTEAAASLAGLPVRQAWWPLAELTAAGLINELQAGRYSLHDLLRSYAGKQAEDTEPEAERDAAAHRAIDCYLQQAYQAALLALPKLTRFLKSRHPPLPGVQAGQINSRAEALAWFRAEQRVLPQVLAWAAGRRLDSQVIHLRTCMEPCDSISNLTAANEAILAAGLRLGDHAAIAAGHYSLGREAVSRGAHDEAARHLQRAFGHAALAGDLDWQAVVQWGLADAADSRGNAAEALDHSRQAVDLARASGAGEAEYLSYLGYLEVQAGNAAQGLADCQQAIDQLRAEGLLLELMGGLERHGISCLIAGRHADAIAHLREAASLARQADSGTAQAEIQMWLGDSYLAAGNAGAARAGWQQALDLYDNLMPGHPDADHIRAKLDHLNSAGPNVTLHA